MRRTYGIWLPKVKRLLDKNSIASRKSQFQQPTASMCTSTDSAISSSESHLRTERIAIGNVEVDAVFQDTMPDSGSKIGTVVASHGIPGSHKDFKYISPLLEQSSIRFVGVNFPGLGYTIDDERLTHRNSERREYVQALMDKLELGEEHPVVFMGHSRGSENALRLGVANISRCAGIVLVNPVLYNKVLNFRVPNGDVAGLCMRIISNIDCSSQLPLIATLNDYPQVPVLLAYSGADPLIERQVSQEMADAFNDLQTLTCHADKEWESTAADEYEGLLKDGHRKVAVRFETEGHFLQKHRATFLVSAIHTMFAHAKFPNNP